MKCIQPLVIVLSGSSAVPPWNCRWHSFVLHQGTSYRTVTVSPLAKSIQGFCCFFFTLEHAHDSFTIAPSINMIWLRYLHRVWLGPKGCATNCYVLQQHIDWIQSTSSFFLIKVRWGSVTHSVLWINVQKNDLSVFFWVWDVDIRSSRRWLLSSFQMRKMSRLFSSHLSVLFAKLVPLLQTREKLLGWQRTLAIVFRSWHYM